MLQRQSFIPVFSCLIGGLAWWSSQVQSPIRSNIPHLNLDPEVKRSQLVNRRELIETLDRLIAYQHYYHSVYGRFTKFINRTGFTLPRTVSEHYDVRIVDATVDRLLVNAFSEINGKVTDLISIDQDYQLHANFDLPSARPEYLKEQALKHFRLIKDLPSGQALSEESVYKGYFQYSVQTNSKDEKVGFAIGIREPVKGLRVEFNGEESLKDSPESLVFSDLMKDPTDHYIPAQTGQFTENARNQLEEETFLAQKIFMGEMGRYAKSWSELSRIAHFRFAGKDQVSQDDGLVLEKEEVQISSKLLGNAEIVQSGASRKVSSDSMHQKLDIEPIQSDQ